MHSPDVYCSSDHLVEDLVISGSLDTPMTPRTAPGCRTSDGLSTRAAAAGARGRKQRCNYGCRDIVGRARLRSGIFALRACAQSADTRHWRARVQREDTLLWASKRRTSRSDTATASHAAQPATDRFEATLSRRARRGTPLFVSGILMRHSPSLSLPLLSRVCAIVCAVLSTGRAVIACANYIVRLTRVQESRRGDCPRL